MNAGNNISAIAMVGRAHSPPDSAPEYFPEYRENVDTKVIYLVTARHLDAAPLGNHRKIKCIF